MSSYGHLITAEIDALNAKMQGKIFRVYNVIVGTKRRKTSTCIY